MQPSEIQTFMDITVISGLSAFFASLAAGIWGRAKLGDALGVIGALISLAGVIMIVWLDLRPPLLGSYETSIGIVAILGLLAVWRPGISKDNHRVVLWCRGFCAIMLGSLLLLPREMTPDSFMFDYPLLLLFFQMRIISIALLLYASACYAGAFSNKVNGQTGPPPRIGRTFIIWGCTAFLVSEYCGTVWSFYWLGDFWHWSAGFMESTLLFLVIAIPMHLPARLAASPKILAAAGMLPGLAMAAVTFIHQIGRS